MAFTTRHVADAVAHDVVASLGDTFDAVADLAVPLPIAVLLRSLGAHPEDLADVIRWASDAVLASDPFLPEAVARRVEASERELRTYLRALFPAEEVTAAHAVFTSGWLAATDLIASAVAVRCRQPDVPATEAVTVALGADRPLVLEGGGVEDGASAEAFALTVSTAAVAALDRRCGALRVAGCPSRRRLAVSAGYASLPVTVELG